MDKLSYALGVNIAEAMTKSGVDELQSYDDFLSGIKDVLENTEKKLTDEEVKDVLDSYYDTAMKKIRIREQHEAEQNLQKSKEYLQENAKKEGVKKTDSGLQYRVLEEGGIMKWPNVHSRVRVHYEGKFPDGTVFDSSYRRGEPIEFGLDQVIPGWAEGVCLMKPGSKYEFTIPPHLGYGETGVKGVIPGNSVLIFTVELLDIL